MAHVAPLGVVKTIVLPASPLPTTGSQLVGPVITGAIGEVTSIVNVVIVRVLDSLLFVSVTVIEQSP